MSIYRAPYISAEAFLHMHTIDPDFDLVAEMEWEDDPRVEFITLEAANLEESSSSPVWGLEGVDDGRCASNGAGSVNEYVAWFYDNEDCDIEV